jgi:hypothetical protein
LTKPSPLSRGALAQKRRANMSRKAARAAALKRKLLAMIDFGSDLRMSK